MKVTDKSHYGTYGDYSPANYYQKRYNEQHRILLLRIKREMEKEITKALDDMKLPIKFWSVTPTIEIEFCWWTLEEQIRRNYQKLIKAVYGEEAASTIIWDEVGLKTETGIMQERIKTLLTPREQKLLHMRFGLKDGLTRTLHEVAEAFNVTQERIRQIEARALQRVKMNKPSPGSRRKTM